MSAFISPEKAGTFMYGKIDSITHPPDTQNAEHPRLVTDMKKGAILSPDMIM